MYHGTSIESVMIKKLKPIIQLRIFPKITVLRDPSAEGTLK